MIIKHQLKVIVLSLIIAGLSLPSLHAQTDTLAQHRKKVGLVLCGGGAKGAAHVGVLKVLEKAGIPIDYIAGTSMGAIIGGLYAAGYCANDLDSLISAQNWTALLSDQVDASSIASAHRQVGDKYLLSVPISLSNKKVELPTGAVRGRNVLNLFNELTIGYHDSISFDNLTIPFSAVACDLVTGKAVVMNSGSLATAMRASMSIPGVFEPVRIGDQVLVDGGVVNNFPADVLREMGAEIVIGVELSQGLQDAETVNSIMGMVNQLTVMLELETHHKNLALIDCLIAPDVNPYTAASFTPDALR
ncbi:MAG: patatin-like phospholipase family protein, partial [Bacteroidales bacterium]|nr:patatin-like phospholipase family protein [Bacteroidales bacterium]